MADADNTNRKEKDLLERAQAYLSLLSASLLPADELLKLIEAILKGHPLSRAAHQEAAHLSRPPPPHGKHPCRQQQPPCRTTSPDHGGQYQLRQTSDPARR